MGAFLDGTTATAVSFIVSADTGVSPMLTLFIMGLLENINPSLLNMSGSIETLLASWPSMVVLGGGMILEFIGKCVPVLDEIVDSAMTFVVPLMSILGTVSTFGLFDMPDSVEEYIEDYNNNGDDAGDDDGAERRFLSIASGALIFFQIILVLIGIILALSMHGIKMLVRLIGEGWLTNCIAVLEAMWCTMTITIAIFIRPIAIFIAACIVVACIYGIRRHLEKRAEKREQEANLEGSEYHQQQGDGGSAFVQMGEQKQSTPSVDEEMQQAKMHNMEPPM